MKESISSLYPLLARALPYLFPLAVVRPGGTSEAATAYLVRYLTFLALVLGWSGCQALLLRFAQTPDDKSAKKIAVLLISAVFALSLFVIAQGIFKQLAGGFPAFLVIISASSLATVARRRSLTWALPLLAAVWWIGIPYLGISLLFTGWAWPPFLYSVVVGVLLASLDLSQDLQGQTIKTEPYGRVYAVLLLLAPVLTGLMSMAGLQLPTLTAIYLLLPLFGRHLQYAQKEKFLRGESLPLYKATGACILLFALTVTAIQLAALEFLYR